MKHYHSIEAYKIETGDQIILRSGSMTFNVRVMSAFTQNDGKDVELQIENLNHRGGDSLRLRCIDRLEVIR